MSQQVQLRRGNTVVNSTFIGAQGELVADTDLNIVILHDGSTAGGHPVASEAYVDAAITGNISGVSSFNNRTGNVTLTSGDVTTALTFTPYNASNPASYTTLAAVGAVGYITGINSSEVVAALGYTPYDANVNANAYTTLSAVAGVGYITATTANVVSFNGNTGAVTLSSADVTGALGFTPPSTTGTGASGTWGINITGNAAIVTVNAQPNITSVGNLTSLLSTGNVTALSFYSDSGPIVGDHNIPGVTGPGTVVADAFITVQADLYPNYFQIGTLDAFQRYEIHSEMPNTVLRLGGWGTDGDLMNTPSEGIVVYGNSIIGGTPMTSDGAYARVKANRFGLWAGNASLPAYAGGAYYYRVDDIELYFKNDGGISVLHVDRITGDTVITGNVTAPTFVGNVTGDANNASYLGGSVSTDYAKLASPVFTGVPVLPIYTVGLLPGVVVGGVIYVSDATGAFGTGSMCFANATAWVDVTTGNAVV